MSLPGTTKGPLIRVEFFSIPRVRTGVAEVSLHAKTLGGVLSQLQERFPALTPECLRDAGLAPGYLACLNARHFTTDITTPVHEGDTILILSADVGG